MGLELHTIDVPKGGKPARQDRIMILMQQAVANAAGGGAGQAVNVDVTGLELPNDYTVSVQPGQDATWFITNKTNAGFRIVLNPRLAANTLAAGTVDFVVLA